MLVKSVLIVIQVLGVALSKVSWTDDNIILGQIKHVITQQKLPILNAHTCGLASNSTATNLRTTVLTAFVNIGLVPASDVFATSEKNPVVYLEWLKMFKVIENPVVFFTENSSVAHTFINIRGNRPTLVVEFSKYTSWAFSTLLDQLKEFMATGLYRTEGPCSYPEYAAVTNAKFEFMKIAANLNFFNSSYITWLDVGIFRDLLDQSDIQTPFYLHPPTNYEHDKLLITQTYNSPKERFSHRRIMLQTISHYCGAIWMSTVDIMKRFIDVYLEHVEMLAGEGLANCDEQIVSVMYSNGSPFRPEVQIQPFWPIDYGYRHDWYGMAHYLRDLGLQKEMKTEL